MNRKDRIIDTAEIKMDNLPKDEAFALTTRLAELGYSVTSEVSGWIGIIISLQTDMATDM